MLFSTNLWNAIKQLEPALTLKYVTAVDPPFLISPNTCCYIHTFSTFNKHFLLSPAFYCYLLIKL